MSTFISQYRFVILTALLICGIIALHVSTVSLSSKSSKMREIGVLPQVALATGQYHATGGALITGTASTTGIANSGDWKATLGNDANYWAFLRSNGGTPGFDAQLYFDDVNLYSANKMLITLESGNGVTNNAYTHQICDWVSSTGVDNAADAQCTGGGWRTLVPRRTNLTDTTSVTRVYEIYDGYFSTRTASPGVVVDTPLSNFASSTNNRVMIRSYSSVSSVIAHYMDFAQIEVAIDPVYEPAGFATTSAGVTTNFISDILGSSYTTVTPADNANRFSVPMAAISTPLDFYFSFKNVKTYTGMNTILVSSDMCRSNAALTFNMYLYDFQNSTWTGSASSSIAMSACTTDRELIFSFNDATVGGFSFEDHISPTGEIRLRFLTNGPGVVYNLQFDRLYIMLGSVNTDTAQCEISWGSGTATDCDNTRDIQDGITNTPSTQTWQQTTAAEYPAAFYSQDNDDDGNNAEHAASANLSFPIRVASSTSITGIHYAVKHRSNSTLLTSDVQILNYEGTSGVSGDAAGSGWLATPGTDTNALTTYSYFDTVRLVEQQNNPDAFVDTINNRMNMRIRTSVSTAVAGVTRDIDFAMMSVRYLEKIPPQYITMSISDNTVGFGTLSSLSSRYATGDALGTTTPSTTAHTISIATNAPDGYTLTVSGTSLVCSACNNEDINPIGETATTSLVGREQFGLQIATSSGNATLYTPYNSNLWAFATSAFPDTIATGLGDETTTQYILRYLANIESLTEAGDYNANVIYTVTGSF